MLGDLESGLDMGEVKESLGGGWGGLAYLGHFIRKGLRLEFGIWVGTPLF